jgi:CelD/BcsL family acetyltransferase involved in cellulose biosynthesis
VTEPQRSPYVGLAAGWEAFERSLDRKFATDLRRRRRQLERDGEVEIAVDNGRERLDKLLDEGFQVETSGWKAAGGTAITSNAQTERFYREVARWAASRGWLRLAFLRLDGRPLAFQYAIEDGRAYHFLKGGHDPAFRRFAPGKLLVHAMLERAFASKLDSFEFLGAAEPWKLDWTPEVRERIRLQRFRRSPLGLVHYCSAVAAYHDYGRPAARRLVGRLR